MQKTWESGLEELEIVGLDKTCKVIFAKYIPELEMV
jgi:hypothetical protein